MYKNNHSVKNLRVKLGSISLADTITRLSTPVTFRGVFKRYLISLV